MSVVMLDVTGQPMSLLEVAADAIKHYQQCLAAWRFYLKAMEEIRGHVAARRFDEAIEAADRLEVWIATNVGEMDALEREIQVYLDTITRAREVERHVSDATPLPKGTRTH